MLWKADCEPLEVHTYKNWCKRGIEGWSTENSDWEMLKIQHKFRAYECEVSTSFPWLLNKLGGVYVHRKMKTRTLVIWWTNWFSFKETCFWFYDGNHFLTRLTTTSICRLFWDTFSIRLPLSCPVSFLSWTWRPSNHHNGPFEPFPRGVVLKWRRFDAEARLSTGGQCSEWDVKHYSCWHSFKVCRLVTQ